MAALPLAGGLAGAGTSSGVVGKLVGAAAGIAIGAAAQPQTRKWESSGQCYSKLKGPNALGQRWYKCRTCNATICVTCAGTRHKGHNIDRTTSTVPKRGTCASYKDDTKAVPQRSVPGKPTEKDGFTPPKKSDGKKVKNPNGPGYGWLDDKGRVWVPSGADGHGGPHWDVQNPKGGYINIYPGGKKRGGK